MEFSSLNSRCVRREIFFAFRALKPWGRGHLSMVLYTCVTNSFQTHSKHASVYLLNCTQNKFFTGFQCQKTVPSRRFGQNLNSKHLFKCSFLGEVDFKNNPDKLVEWTLNLPFFTRMIDFGPYYRIRHVTHLIVKKVCFHALFGHACVQYHTWVPPLGVKPIFL